MALLLSLRLTKGVSPCQFEGLRLIKHGRASIKTDHDKHKEVKDNPNIFKCDQSFC